MRSRSPQSPPGSWPSVGGPLNDPPAITARAAVTRMSGVSVFSSRPCRSSSRLPARRTQASRSSVVAAPRARRRSRVSTASRSKRMSRAPGRRTGCSSPVVLRRGGDAPWAGPGVANTAIPRSGARETSEGRRATRPTARRAVRSMAGPPASRPATSGGADPPEVPLDRVDELGDRPERIDPLPQRASVRQAVGVPAREGANLVEGEALLLAVAQQGEVVQDEGPSILERGLRRRNAGPPLGDLPEDPRILDGGPADHDSIAAGLAPEPHGVVRRLDVAVAADRDGERLLEG